MLNTVVNDNDTSSTEEENRTRHAEYSVTDRGDCYEIQNILLSDAATILFTRHKETKQAVVMKVLRKFADTRYCFDTLHKRQDCQREALRWNKLFASGVYRGLSAILDQNEKEIWIGAICNDPAEEENGQGAERDYALIMEPLPDEQRLDLLLNLLIQEQNSEACEKVIDILAEQVAYMHKKLVEPAEKEIDGLQVGSIEQLRKKLEHNMSFLKKVIERKDGDRYRQYRWLKRGLQQILQHPQYVSSFEQRMGNQYIKRCHGDLKAPNIWIDLSELENHKENGQCVKILDTVDFKPLYCNIDILSDFAMLVADLLVRMRATRRAERMIERMIGRYLQLTGQVNERARSVLSYYVIEKAVVGATVNILYDNAPNLGLAFFEIAEKRMKALERELGIKIARNVSEEEEKTTAFKNYRKQWLKEVVFL